MRSAEQMLAERESAEREFIEAKRDCAAHIARFQHVIFADNGRSVPFDIQPSACRDDWFRCFARLERATERLFAVLNELYPALQGAA